MTLTAAVPPLTNSDMISLRKFTMKKSCNTPAGSFSTWTDNENKEQSMQSLKGIQNCEPIYSFLLWNLAKILQDLPSFDV